MVPSLTCFLLFCVSLASAKECEPADFQSEFTDCDKQNGRWLVWVPKNCTGGFPPPPQRQNNCVDISCNAGEYVDLNSQTRACKPCGPGYYSLGSAQRYVNWTRELSDSTTFTISTDSFASGGKVNCSGQGWRVVGDRLIATISDACTSELTFSAKLSRRGYARFTYQFTDPFVSFQFDVSNGRCGSPQMGSKAIFVPEVTNSSDSNRFYSQFISLSSGVNILRWTVSKFAQSLGRKSGSSSSSASSRWQAPQVLIGSIEVNGLSYVAECTKCPAGTYSNGGSGNCTSCERNYYSTEGSSQCIPCPSDQYSEPGWASCLNKPLCTSQHYFLRPGDCVDGHAKMRATWIDPKVCEGGEGLPETSDLVQCNVCNPGMTLVKSNGSTNASDRGHTCEFCPPERPYSDGNSECQPCPPNTVEQIGLAYHWFNELPPGVHTMCASVSTDSCPHGVDGWQAAGSYLRTSPLRVPRSRKTVGTDLSDYFQLLVLHIDDGFITPPGLPTGSLGQAGDERLNFEYARLTVEVEVLCVAGHDCELTLNEGRRHHVSSGHSGPLRTWENTVPRQTFSYGIRSPGPVSFTFAFNYNATDSSTSDRVSEARIISIVLSNVRGAGATACKKCENKENEQCVPCPDGSYMKSDGSCAPCPLNTVSYASKIYTLVPDIPRGIEACMPCGNGLKPDASRSRCVLDCSDKLIGSNYTFDLAAFSGVHTITSHRVFSPQGQPFFYLLNMTVCEHETVVRCVPPPPNVTNWRTRLRSSLGALADYEDEDVMYGQLACYVTVLSNALSTGSASGTRSRSATVLPGPDDGYFSPVNLGMAISRVLAPGIDEPSRTNLSNLLVDAGFESSQSDNDVFIIYESVYEGSESCPDGRYLVLTLRCDPDTPTNATSAIELPPNCPEGTCDGCVYVTMWRSRAACPVCDPEKDVRTLVGECVRGQQTVYYEPAPHCYYRDTQLLASRSQVRSCPYLPLEGYIALGIAALLLVGACGVACAYRSKTRKLEYKYMRLVQQAGGQYAGELAGAESCAVQEGELDESAVDESVEPTRKTRHNHKATKKRSGNGQQALGNDAGSDAGGSDEDEINVDFKNMKLQPMRSESGDPKVSALSRIMDRFKKNEDRGSSLMDEDDA